MSVKDRLRRKVQSFHESDIECPDEDALLELVEAMEDYAIYSGPARWQAIRDALQRITEDS